MSTNGIFNQMLSGYDITTGQQKRNAIFEVNQQIVLAGLYTWWFFQRSCFLRWNLSAHIPWIAAFLRGFGFFSSCS